MRSRTRVDHPMAMRLLKRRRVGLVLPGFRIPISILVAYRLKDRQARAATGARRDVLVGVRVRRRS